MLTLADVTAIKINDLDGAAGGRHRPGGGRGRVRRRHVRPAVHDGFFHADPHPGNIFVTPVGAERRRDAGGRAWTLTFIDFGMMGEVTDTLRRGLQRLMIAVASRDGKGLVDSIQEVGVLLPSADTVELERAMTAAVRPLRRHGLRRAAAGRPAGVPRLRDGVRRRRARLPFQLPENFLLIIRAMSLTSGMCSSLDPEFNMWDAVEPYAGAAAARRAAATSCRRSRRRRCRWRASYARLPRRLDELTTRLESGRLAVDNPRLDRRMRRLERMGRRVVSAVLFAGLLIGGVLRGREDSVFGTVLMVGVGAGAASRPVRRDSPGRRGPSD